MTVIATDKKSVSKLSKTFTALVTAFEVLLVILLSYFMSLLIKGMISEPAEISSDVVTSSQAVVFNNNDDFSNLILTDAFFGGIQTQSVQALIIAPESSLDLKVYGLRTNGKGQGTAILKPQGEVQKLFQTGENVTDAVKLTSVYHDRIEISRNGVTETIYLDKERSKRAGSLQKAMPTRQNLQSSNHEKIEIILAALDLDAYRQNKRISGFEVGDNAEQIILERSGLKKGDILYEVNGVELLSWERLKEIREYTKTSGFNIKFERHGEIQTKTLSNLILGL